MRLVAYPLPTAGHWNVVDVHKPRGGEYTAVLNVRGIPLSIVNRRGRQLKLEGDTADRVMRAISVKIGEMKSQTTCG